MKSKFEAHLKPDVTPLNQGQITVEAPETFQLHPLNASRRAELWSGRFAMVGFLTTAIAIVVHSVV